MKKRIRTYDFKKDLDYAVKSIEDNYPFLSVHQRVDGLDWETHTKNIYERFKEVDSIDKFKELLETLCAPLNDHCALLNSRHLYAAANFEKTGYKAKLIKKSIINSVYQTPEINSNTDFNPIQSGLTLEERENHIIIRVEKFPYSLIENDHQEICSFLKQHAGLSKNIIFDIRDNPGGSSLYYIENMVRPFLHDNIRITNYYLFRGGSHSKPYLNSIGIRFRPISKYTGPLIPQSDRKLFKYFHKASYLINAFKSPFDYNEIFVVSNSKNFSSSESFLVFCKQTGFAKIVGQKGGGDGIGFESLFVRLPSTGLILAYPIALGLNSDGTINYEHSTKPDFPIDDKTDPIQYIINRNFHAL